VCDLAYLLLVEQVERQTLADRQVAAFQMVMSGEGGQLPTVAEARQQLDAALIAVPVEATAVDVEQAELRRALGVM
jgi:hypothetical protein